MYAAHFAAALAIKTRVPKAPAWALLAGAFLPDFFWVAFGLAGVEPSQGPNFFDDWSHSLAMVLLWATLFALPFWKQGRAVILAIWMAVLSHFLLDLPIHPKNLALYPHSALHLGWDLWGIGPRKYWYAQLGVLLALTFVYGFQAWRWRWKGNLVAASCIMLIGLHLLMWP